MSSEATMRVLLVEDDEGTREELARAIRSFGYPCETAKDGAEAWELHQREQADVIISDRAMPGMDGDALCQVVRLHDNSHYTHFIFATAHGTREDILQGMRMGADDYLIKPIDLEQLEVRLAAAWRVVSHERLIAQRNVRLRRESERFYKAAHIDTLTGLRNRLQLEEDLQELRDSKRLCGSRWTLAMCDVDWFKAYNDQYGHLVGDRALTAVGSVFRENMRSGDRCYRYGGEEFLILLRDHTNAQAQAAMERVRHTIQSLRLAHAGSPLGTVTISIGFAEAVAGPELDTEAWVARADAALYRAKAEGRNRIVGEQKASKPSERAGTILASPERGGSMEIRITFPGHKRVQAQIGPHLVVSTDQSLAHGGDDVAPEPYDLFLASIGTCAGAYLLAFCDARNIPTADIAITQRQRFDPAQKRLERVSLEIALPENFPEKYRDSLVRAVEGCKVKRTLGAPPEIVVEATSVDGRGARAPAA